MANLPKGYLFLGAILLAVAVKVVAFPARIPALLLPSSDGEMADLGDLGGKEIGVILYASKTPCGGHSSFMATSVAVHRMMAESARYQVKVVYGDQTEEEARAFAKQFPDVPIVLDPEKRFAEELGIRYYSTILYDASGKILDEQEGQGLMAKPGLEAYLDEKTL